MALLNPTTASNITIKQLMDMMKNNVITTSEFAHQVIGIDYSINSTILKEHIELKPEVQDKITFVERALRIYHSSTGGRSINMMGVTEQMVFPEEANVYFYMKVQESAIRELVFVIQDIYFEIPINNIPTGMGFSSEFKRDPQPKKAVENVKGEIADFMGDYMDEYGTEDEFVP